MTLVVFDIDGTLTNTKAIDDLCFINSIRECWNCDLGDVDWNPYVNVTDTGLAKDIFKSFFAQEIGQTEIMNLKNLFSEKIISSAKENPKAFLEVKGAKDFVKELENQNIKVAIATGGWRVTAQFKLMKIGLELENFPFSTSDDHYSRGEILNRAIVKAKEGYQTNFNKIIYIGDGLWDYKTSRELEIDFIGIDYLKNGKLKEYGVKTVFEDFSDKDKIIRKIRHKIGM
jgi:phosphoglycolate phosphatase-like HAD superfamily hydrolase